MVASARIVQVSQSTVVRFLGVSILGAATLTAGCSRDGKRSAVDAAPATRALTIEGTNVCLAVPQSLVARTAHNDHGYVDVIVGDAGRDRCVVGIEVYLSAAPERPRSLADLRVSIEKDHSTTYEVTAAPTIVERQGRPTVTATLRNPANGVKERQWAFFFERDPIVLSFYATGRVEDCEPLENSVLSTIRNVSCGD